MKMRRNKKRRYGKSMVPIEGHYDRHTAHIRDWLFNAHTRVTEAMVGAGLETFHAPSAGLFLWAKLPIRPGRKYCRSRMKL
jgi:DNA-binding transcriptional MocR family regulator